MATVTAISTKGGSGGKATLEYICRDDKTDNQKYVTTLNCSLPTVYQEFKNTREMYGKTGGIKYYHFVQSHPSGYEIQPELAHKIAVEFAEKAFKGYECVVATHIDAEHIHSHIVFNAVNADSGMKYHSNKFTLNDIRNLSDEICQKYGVQTLEKPVVNQRTDGITTGEYRSAMKGESWKIDLINTIDVVMKQAKTQKQFCFLMRQRGYGVRWEDSRKYITYTCPNGRKCRCAKLHGEKFLKEMMEYEFEIRRECLDGTQQIRPEGGGGNHAHGGGGQPELDGGDQPAEKILRGTGGTVRITGRADDEIWNRNAPAESESAVRSGGKRMQEDSEIHSGTDKQFTDQSHQSIGETVITGWEAERGILLAAERIRRMEAQNAIENAQVGCDFAVGALDIVAGIADVASIMDESEEDEEIERHSDSKVLAEEIRRKEALGIHMG